jgi:hypothetical protein
LSDHTHLSASPDLIQEAFVCHLALCPVHEHVGFGIEIELLGDENVNVSVRKARESEEKAIEERRAQGNEAEG